MLTASIATICHHCMFNFDYFFNSIIWKDLLDFQMSQLFIFSVFGVCGRKNATDSLNHVSGLLYSEQTGAFTPQSSRLGRTTWLITANEMCRGVTCDTPRLGPWKALFRCTVLLVLLSDKGGGLCWNSWITGWKDLYWWEGEITNNEFCVSKK